MHEYTVKYPYYKQTLNDLKISKFVWRNRSIPDEQVIDELIYKVTKSFDPQDRLIKSSIYDPGVSEISCEVKLIYP